MRRSILHLTLFALAAFATSHAAADWLVLESGERVETRGPWKIEGSRVLFTGSNGTLSSIRLSQVDVEASEAANRPAAAQPAPAASPAQPARPPALVLTDSNVARARRVDAPATSDAEASEASQRELRVASWQETALGADGLTFDGTLQNPTEYFAVLVEVKATIFDAEGRELETATGKLPAASVGPHETQSFEVTFPGVFSYSNVEFDVTYKFLKGSASESSTESDDAPSDTDEDTESPQPDVG